MSLRVWLPLTKDLRNQGLDDVMVTNNGATFDVNGKLGGCYSFGISNSYITVDSTPLKTFTEFSFACWVKIISWNTNYSTIFAVKNSTGVSWNNLIFSLLRDSSSSALCFNISNGSNYTSNSCRTEALSLNTWYHITCTYKSGQIKLYQDGNVVNTYNTSVVPNFSSIVNLWIGKSNENSYQSNSLLNDVRIYDHCLSQMEVKEISKGLVLHYPLNRNGWGQENLLSRYVVPGQAAPTSTAAGGRTTWLGDYKITIPATENADTYFRLFTTKQLTANATYTISCQVSGLKDGSYYRFPLYAQNNTGMGVLQLDHNGLCSLTFTMTYGTQTAATGANGETVYICFMDDSGRSLASGQGAIIVSNFKLEEGSVATPWCPNSSDTFATIMGLNDNIEYDTSGYENNGMRIGTFSWTSDTPKYNVSTKFSANTIKNTIFNFTSNIWTVAFWYYYDTASSAYQGFLCLSRNAGGDADKKLAAMPKSSYIWFKFENTNLTVSSLKIKVWTHIVMTFDGTNGKVYENGVLKGTTGAASSIYTNCDDFVIGARANAADATTTTCQLIGNMSDVRIYATALSTDDIKALYQNSAYIDNQGNIYGAIYEEV